MTTITITRHYSDMTNVADSFSLGHNEHDGNAAVAAYTLPEGYVVEAGAIYDPAGFVCAIVAGDTGKGAPLLVSRAGHCADQVLIVA